MRDFPSCFGENGVQVADASCSSNVLAIPSKVSQNLVTCIHQCRILGKSCLVCISWSRNLMGYCFSVEIDDLSHRCLCKVDVKPSLFSKRKGCKNLVISSCKIDLFWDLCDAKFGSGPEPLEDYFVALVCKGEMVFLIGDLKKEACKKTNSNLGLIPPMFVSKREHLFGKRAYGTKAQFCENGRIHDLKIECDAFGVENEDPCLVIRIDSKPVMQVKHVHWKFRGNYAVLIDGVPVEVFWDVYNWLFGQPGFGNAVFVFQSCLSADKVWRSSGLGDDHSMHPWISSDRFGEVKKPGSGFSLVLYAWKNE